MKEKIIQLLAVSYYFLEISSFIKECSNWLEWLLNIKKTVILLDIIHITITYDIDDISIKAIVSFIYYIMFE